MDFPGVRQVTEIFEAKLKKLGFTTSRVDLLKVHRANHLVAEHKGTGPQILLLGHLDTVFEKSSGFLTYKPIDAEWIGGPGTSDMKGGDIVMLSALEALNETGALAKMNITIVMTGDEEYPGEDQDGSLTTTRGPMIEWAKKSDYALSFEPRNGKAPGLIVARRGASQWNLKVHAKSGHSGMVFSKDKGPGAIYPISKILAKFYDQMRKEKLRTFNVGNMAGATVLMREKGNEEFGATLSGKDNVIPPIAEAYGEFRAISPQQVKHTHEQMQRIVKNEIESINKDYDSDAKVSAEIEFNDKYPPMALSAGNQALETKMKQVSLDLGFEALNRADPMVQGAGDIAFAAQYVKKGALDGLGVIGFDFHTNKERAGLTSFKEAVPRAALLLYRLNQ